MANGQAQTSSELHAYSNLAGSLRASLHGTIARDYRLPSTSRQGLGCGDDAVCDDAILGAGLKGFPQDPCGRPSHLAPIDGSDAIGDATDSMVGARAAEDG